MSLQKTVSIVTGGGQGISKALSEATPQRIASQERVIFILSCVLPFMGVSCKSPFDQIIGQAGCLAHHQKWLLWDGHLARPNYVYKRSNEEAGKETEAEFKHLGSIRFFHVDESDEDSVKKLI